MAFLAAQEYKMFVSRHADRRIEASLHKKKPRRMNRVSASWFLLSKIRGAIHETGLTTVNSVWEDALHDVNSV